MSKIQEALRKVQEGGLTATRQSGGSGSPARRPLASLDETVTLSTLTEDQIPEHLIHAEAKYGGRPLIVDSDALIEAGFLAKEGLGQRRLADEFRQIKRPILANARGKKVTRPERANLLMVASAMTDEGKTFTCINLALSVAREKDWNVVLADVDCAKQHITSMFSAESERGLLDLLKDPSIHPDEVIMPTNIPSLSILPAGRRDQNAAELLASERMDQVADILSREDRFRLIIMDSSPLLLTTEAPILSSHVGQIALVVNAGHTSQSAVLTALEKLDSSKAINAILNRAETSPTTAYGGYYGYYGDDIDSEDADSEQRE